MNSLFIMKTLFNEFFHLIILFYTEATFWNALKRTFNFCMSEVPDDHFIPTKLYLIISILW